ncbi:hypothetical protein ABM187_004236 [Stenotrophomonas maltophilia]
MTTDNKTLAVDVLAVMDHESDRIEERIGYGLADDLRDARAACAELIASGVRVAAAFRALGLDDSLINRSRLARECEEALVAFDTALVRVKGESA